jgi:hypothetical protein
LENDVTLSSGTRAAQTAMEAMVGIGVSSGSGDGSRVFVAR